MLGRETASRDVLSKRVDYELLYGGLTNLPDTMFPRLIVTLEETRIFQNLDLRADVRFCLLEGFGDSADIHSLVSQKRDNAPASLTG